MELDVAAEIGVDLATKADLETLVRRLEEKYKQQILAADSRVTDGTGKCGFRVYDIPDGMQFYPSRYIVWSDAHVPSTAGCFQSTSCYGGIYHGLPSPINIADYFPPPSGGISESATPNIIPYYKEFNRHDSPEFQAPDNVYFSLINGPISTNVTCILYGWLEELREGRSAQFRVKRSRMHHRRRGTPTPVLAGHDSDATLG